MGKFFSFIRGDNVAVACGIRDDDCQREEGRTILMALKVRWDCAVDY